ncbi:hypothetical protein CRUP_026469, partial [Coryphaenoides rupestris]
MSELFMECEEEELEPWQKHILEVNLIDDDDDDDPIFVGELVNNPKSVKPSPPPGFIVQPQLTTTNFIATLGKQYPPGTSFTIV